MRRLARLSGFPSAVPDRAYATASWDYAHRPPAEAELVDIRVPRGLIPYAMPCGSGPTLRPGRVPAYDNFGTRPPRQRGRRRRRGSGDTPSATINTTTTARTILTFTLLPAPSVCTPARRTALWSAGRARSPETCASPARADADPAGGDGIAWIIDHRTGGAPEELASGDFPNGGAQEFAQGKGADRLASIPVRAGDEIQLLVLPKETTTMQYHGRPARSHRGKDQTGRDQQEGTGRRRPDVSGIGAGPRDDPLQNGKGNPHSDHYGNPGVGASTTWRTTTVPASP